MSTHPRGQVAAADSFDANPPRAGVLRGRRLAMGAATLATIAALAGPGAGAVRAIGEAADTPGYGLSKLWVLFAIGPAFAAGGASGALLVLRLVRRRRIDRWLQQSLAVAMGIAATPGLIAIVGVVWLATGGRPPAGVKELTQAILLFTADGLEVLTGGLVLQLSATAPFCAPAICALGHWWDAAPRDDRGSGSPGLSIGASR